MRVLARTSLRSRGHTLAALVWLACISLARPAEGADRVVAIVPVGEVNARTLRIVSEAVAAAGVTTRIEAARPIPPDAWYAPRRRYRAARLLSSVQADPPADAWKIVVVTDLPISATKGRRYDWGIGGFSYIGGGACILSTYLLRNRPGGSDLFETRLRKLALHEFGHSIGLPHCEVFACVMRDARGALLRMLDTSTERWCGRCRRRIEGGEHRD